MTPPTTASPFLIDEIVLIDGIGAISGSCALLNAFEIPAPDQQVFK